MSELKVDALPLVPLDGGAVLPHMVATLPLESDEGRAAVGAAMDGFGLVVLVPRDGGRYASVGTVAKVEDSGRLPDGDEVCVVRGLNRARIGTGVPGNGRGLWVQVEVTPDPIVASAHARELANEYRALVENVLELRNASGIAQFPDPAGTAMLG